jgi:hypothetical protein
MPCVASHPQRESKASDASEALSPLARRNRSGRRRPAKGHALLPFRRESHHAFLLGGVAAVSLRIEQAGKPVGYAYISPVGHIGPLAMLPGTDAQSVLAAVLQRALDVQPNQVSLVIPGRADRMLDAAFQLGFRIDEPFVLLSAQPFGDWSHYLPSNPGFM